MVSNSGRLSHAMRRAASSLTSAAMVLNRATPTTNGAQSDLCCCTQTSLFALQRYLQSAKALSMTMTSFARVETFNSWKAEVVPFFKSWCRRWSVVFTSDAMDTWRDASYSKSIIIQRFLIIFTIPRCRATGFNSFHPIARRL